MPDAGSRWSIPGLGPNRVQDGPACRGCGLPNYHGLCPVCRGDEDEARRDGMPYPWRDDDRSDAEGWPDA